MAKQRGGSCCAPRQLGGGRQGPWRWSSGALLLAAKRGQGDQCPWPFVTNAPTFFTTTANDPGVILVQQASKRVFRRSLQFAPVGCDAVIQRRVLAGCAAQPSIKRLESAISVIMVGGSLESKDRRHSHWTLEHVGILSGHAGSKAWQKPAHVRQGDPMPARANQFEQFGCREIGRSAQRQPGGPPPVYPVATGRLA